MNPSVDRDELTRLWKAMKSSVKGDELVCGRRWIHSSVDKNEPVCIILRRKKNNNNYLAEPIIIAQTSTIT